MKKHHLSSKASLEKFHNAIYQKMKTGFILTEENKSVPFVVLSKEKKEINHSLHFLLCCLTIGIWFMIWVCLIIEQSYNRTVIIAIDENGNVFEDKCQTP